MNPGPKHMAAEHWFRWHHGCVTDPKFRVIASRCVTNVTVGHVVAVWAAMMENASQASPRGVLSGWDDEDVAAGFGFTVEQVSDIRRAMQGKVLDGESLNAWEKRQPKREDSSSDRTKKWRESKRDDSDATKRDVTQRDATKRDVTLETETETEEKEQKKEQAARASRLSPDWHPSPENLAWAKAERPDIDVKAETENFRDHWLAKAGRDATKLDWTRTWQKWIRGAYSRPKSRAGQSVGYQPLPGEC